VRRFRENWLIASEEFDHQIVAGTDTWRKLTVTVTPNTMAAPDGTVTADTISGFVAGAYIYQYGWYGGIPTPLPLGAVFCPSLYMKPISTVGTLKLANPNGSATYGGWTIDLSKLDAEWNRIVPWHPAVTVGKGFTAQGNKSDGLGLWFGSGTGPLSFYAWGAQINLGNDPLPYTKTVAAPVVRS
jgi:hypothetical protein